MAEGDVVVPAGTVTLLLADVEASTRLWEDRGDEMAVAIAELERVVSDEVGRHSGVAERLFVATATVKTHLVHVYAKLGIRNRTQLVSEWLEKHRAQSS